MKADELFEEFLEISHMDKNVISTYHKCKAIDINGKTVADGFEGLMLELKNYNIYGQNVIITYFHDPRVDKK